MTDWQTCAVPDSFVKNKVGRQNQIPAKDIADVGRFPVVDQGQDFVAGYCDDESKIIDFDLSLIIFGDHKALAKNDYNISPSCYIHTSDAETYRPIAAIVGELVVIEAEARDTDKALREILEKIEV